MQLKARGNIVDVFLHKPELTRFQKVQEDLENIALLPCKQQEKAKATAKALDELRRAMTKPDIVDGQKELPLTTDEDPETTEAE